MRKNTFNYIYGPVPSWRIGSSLGIDPLSGKGKICTFDCIYCQIGRTKILSDKRREYVAVDKIVDEISVISELKTSNKSPLNIDYITFSGTGEPTLAKNLGNMINAVRTLRKDKIAVITNSSMMYRQDVRDDLFLADFVIAKLDASSQQSLELINRSVRDITFNMILEGIERFKSEYKGKLALQIMLMNNNIKDAEKIAEIARNINPDEVQINTPLRPCKVKPLPKKEIDKVKMHFKDMNAISVYDIKRKIVKPISSENTLRRRGKVINHADI